MSENTDPQQAIDLKSIGTLLKQKREEQSFTLEHIAEITRITLTNLRNIEQGNMEALPGLVFVRGFIRNYAKLLGFDSDWLIEGFNQAYASRNQTQTETIQSEKIDLFKQNDRSKNRWTIAVISIFLVMIVVVFYWSRKQNIQNSTKIESVETVQAIENQESTTPVEDFQIQLESQVIQKEVEVKAETVKAVISPLTLTLLAMQDEWIRLIIDDQKPFDLLLEKNQKYEWPANEEYQLIMTAGNTASIHLNGEEIIDRENFVDQLYSVTLNKFTLTRINNR